MNALRDSNRSRRARASERAVTKLHNSTLSRVRIEVSSRKRSVGSSVLSRTVACRKSAMLRFVPERRCISSAGSSARFKLTDAICSPVTQPSTRALSRAASSGSSAGVKGRWKNSRDSESVNRRSCVRSSTISFRRRRRFTGRFGVERVVMIQESRSCAASIRSDKSSWLRGSVNTW